MEPLLPFVSILMPIRNERDFIERSLGSVVAQDYPPDRLEVLVVDGMSEDGTRQLIKVIMAAEKHHSIRLLDNPRGIVATALNIGTREARGEILLRVDGHCEIGAGHLRRCVDLLTRAGERPSGVGGPIETISGSLVGRGIAAAMSSRFGVGGSAFRVGVKQSRFADTVPFPAFSRDTVEAAGPYDEELVRNQDDEYNYRIRGLGGRLLLDPALQSRYYSRASLRKLWRQYYQYGFWKVRVLQKHPKQIGLRQLVPAGLVVTLLGTGIVALASERPTILSASVLAIYLTGTLTASILVSAREDLKLLPILPVSFLALHVGYGSGFLVGLVRFWNRWGDHSTLVGQERVFPGRSGEQSK